MSLNATNGPWRRFKIQLRTTWSELTDEDLEAICRDSDDLVDVVRHCYGLRRDETAKQPGLIGKGFPTSELVRAAV